MADINYINKSELNWLQAIRDTEYSHPKLYDDEDPYVYHCGVDIFNNHRLRSNDFICINPLNSGDTTNTTFNTLEDVVRDREGNNVVEAVSYINSAETDVHIYGVDSIMPMDEAFASRVTEENGWYGFINRTDIDIPNAIVNDEEISINKVLNNNKACEFIDFYPDRSLYSFIPKVNKYRNRIEKNWDYCVTYPYENDYEKYNEIVGLDSNLAMDEGGSSVKIINYELQKSPSGNRILKCKTMFKHTLSEGNYISLYINANNSLQKINKNIRILSTGNENGEYDDRYFTIKYSDIAYYFTISDDNELVYNGEGEFNGFYYKKLVGNIECRYYLRKFKKIKNDEGNELSSDVNKLAYGENIYGDRVAQVIFTDDIDVDGLYDNNGRPLTEIYFTVIKRNAGWDKWYEDEDTKSEDIEFSHCFGKVTSGIDLPEECNDYNVRKLHNIIDADSVTKEVLGIPEPYQPIEDDITIDGGVEQDVFYGDIVEFSPIDYTETVLEVVQHRFNTAQRETLNDKYKDIIYDHLQFDDYDDGIINGSTGFTIEQQYLNEYNGERFFGNLNPEGYFYNPFTRIKIREESNILSTVLGQVIRGTIVETEVTGITGVNAYDVQTEIDYSLIKGDTLGFYNTITKETTWLEVYDVDGVFVTFICDDETEIDTNNSIIIKTNDGVPVYAKYIPSTHSFVWKGIIDHSVLTTGSDIYDMPFANGCFYIHDNVNLFLKRQDPQAEFGLLPTNPNNPLLDYSIPGYEKVDTTSDTYFDMNKLGNICY